ncbi:centaurin, beta 1, isoform CRA_b, partial [Mus musculus]
LPRSLWGKNSRPRLFLPEDSSPLIPLLGGGECICLHPHLPDLQGPPGPQSKSSEMTVKLDFEECLKDSPRFRASIELVETEVSELQGPSDYRNGNH